MEVAKIRPGRMSAKSAGYMELAGAMKDGDCTKVDVPGGVSLDLGCCNEYKPGESDADEFRCGECKFHEDKRRNS